MSKRQKLVVGFLALVVVTFLGCTAFQDAITPCYISPDCVEFADANVPVFLPWTTVADAEYVQKKMDYIRSLSELEYSFLQGNMTTHLANARELQ